MYRANYLYVLLCTIAHAILRSLTGVLVTVAVWARG